MDKKSNNSSVNRSIKKESEEEDNKGKIYYRYMIDLVASPEVKSRRTTLD